MVMGLLLLLLGLQAAEGLVVGDACFRSSGYRPSCRFDGLRCVRPPGHDHWEEGNWRLSRFWDKPEDPFTSVQYLVDRVLSLPPLATRPWSLKFESLHEHHGREDPLLLLVVDTPAAIPETFRRFYRGELADVAVLDDPCDNRKHRTVSYRLDLAYRGTDFCGWQTQQHHDRSCDTPAVQDVVQTALQDRNVRVCGRTDKGVHALGQVARVRCEPDVTPQMLAALLAEATTPEGGSNRSWTCRRVVAVPHRFHPTFQATSRSYIYMMDANAKMEEMFGSIPALVMRLNALLRPLQGQTLPYIALSYGRLKTKTSDCTLEHARARFWSMDHQPIVAIELTGDRFLRRMVRILVASALRLCTSNESVDDESFDANALLNLIMTKDRRQAALPAPSQGLVFVSASFE